MVRVHYLLEAEDEPHEAPSHPRPLLLPQDRLEFDAQQTKGTGKRQRDKLYRLQWYHIYCIIVQRMIGTGIFVTSTTIFNLTQNIGVALLFWGLGSIVTLAAAVVYLDFASAIPLVPYGPTRAPTHLPMNGGELIYLTHAFPNARFLISCIFGMIFVTLGNSAANCITFAVHFLRLCGYDSDLLLKNQSHQWAVTGVAIAGSTFVCFLHATWRKWGIRVNNAFAVVKLSMLVFIIFLGFFYPSSGGQGAILTPKASFLSTEKSDWKSFVTAQLDVVFAFGGWSQGNYVFGEVGMSPRAFRRTVLSAVLSVSILYVLVNLSYVWVVQRSVIDNPDLVRQFFRDTLGKSYPWVRTDRLVNFMLAFSSFGNIIVTTFTSARVKQEVAKEGVLLYEKSIHIVRSWSISDRLFDRMARRRGLAITTKPDPHHASHGSMAQSPTPALVLHSVFAILVILIATVTSPPNAYSTILGIYTYLLDVTIPLILAASLIHLRRVGRLPRTPIPRWLSMTCASVVILVYLYVFIMMWNPHDTGSSVSSFVVPGVSLGVLLLGSAYWFGLYVYRQFPRAHEVFHIERRPTVFAKDNRLILVRDKIKLKWQAPGNEEEDETEMPELLSSDGGLGQRSTGFGAAGNLHSVS